MLQGNSALLIALWPCLLFAAEGARADTSPGDCFLPEPGWRCGHFAGIAEKFGRGGGPRGPGQPQPETPYTDVLHTKIDIEVNLAAHEVFGTVTISAASQIDGLTEFVVYLDPNDGQMGISAIGGDVAGPTSFTHIDQKVTLTLDGPYSIGEEFTVSLDYGDTPRSDDGVFWGTHDPGSGSVDLVATLSEAWHARQWWPGKDVLNDKCTFEIWVTVPGTHVVASNGILQGVDPLPDIKLRYRWEEINPMIPYLASLAIGDYKIYATTYDHLGDTMPMAFYILPEYDGPTWRGYCDTYVTMTEVFSDVYGQYPFVDEKGGMAHTPTLGSTFMEHQTIPSMPTFSLERINAHELAHQWWGDTVTCETWGDIWLNEGITSFSEAVWQEFKPGGGTAAYHARMDGRRPSDPDTQVYVIDVDSEGAIFSHDPVYDKGAWVTHMLRHVLGDSVFFQAMLDYRAAFEGDSATTQEFTDSVSATAGFDLSFFTDQWIMNPGSPDYNTSWEHVEAGDAGFVLLRLAQTQVDRGYDLMTMPIDIAVTTVSGTTTVVVWSIDEVEMFAIPIDGVPMQVTLDPDDWILTHSRTQSAPGSIDPYCQGDVNEDGAINGLDIQPFAEVLMGPGAGPAGWRRSDMDFDGRCDLDDLPLFVEALLNGCGL